MKIQPATSSNKTSFGGIVATERALQYLNLHLKPNQITEVNRMFAEQKSLHPDIYLRTTLGFTDKEYLRVDVNGKLWFDQFTTTMRAIKKAICYVKKLNAKVSINRENINIKQLP